MSLLIRASIALASIAAALAVAAPALAASRPWPPPTTLSDPGAGYAYIDVDARGNAIAIWPTIVDYGWQLQYRWYEPGSGWGARRVLPIGGGAYQRVALTPRGQAFLLFDERDRNDHWRTFVTSAPPGGRFAAPVQISEGRVTDEFLVDDEGGALLVQSQLDVSQGGGLFVSERRPGGEFGPAQRLAGGTASSAAAASPAGAAAVVWSATDGSGTMLAYRPAGGDFQPPERLEVPASPNTPLAINTAGEVVVAGSRVNPYTGSSGTTLAVRSPLGEWSAPVTVDDKGTVLQAFAEANGDVSLLSHQPDSSMTLATRHADGSVTGPALVAAPEAGNFRATMSYGGDMLAIWSEHYGDPYWRDDVVKVAERPSGALFGPPVTVSAPGAAAGLPALNDAGTAVAVWAQQTEPGNLQTTVMQAAVRGPRAEAPSPPSVRITGSRTRKIDGRGTLTIPVRCSQRCRFRARGILFVDGRPVAVGRALRTPKRLRARRKASQVRVRFAADGVDVAGGQAWASISVIAAGRSRRPVTITRRIQIR